MTAVTSATVTSVQHLCRKPFNVTVSPLQLGWSSAKAARKTWPTCDARAKRFVCSLCFGAVKNWIEQHRIIAERSPRFPLRSFELSHDALRRLHKSLGNRTRPSPKNTPTRTRHDAYPPDNSPSELILLIRAPLVPPTVRSSAYPIAVAHLMPGIDSRGMGIPDCHVLSFSVARFSWMSSTFLKLFNGCPKLFLNFSGVLNFSSKLFGVLNFSRSGSVGTNPP